MVSEDQFCTGEARLYAEERMHTATGSQKETYMNMQRRFPSQTHEQVVWMVAMLHGNADPDVMAEAKAATMTAYDHYMNELDYIA